MSYLLYNRCRTRLSHSVSSFHFSLRTLIATSSPSPHRQQNPKNKKQQKPQPKKNHRARPASKMNNLQDQHYALTSQQQQILSAVAAGRSVFITGSGGTGKTTLLASIIHVLRGIHPPQSVFVTASTGVAACALGGQTLHSFAGIGLGRADLDSLLSKVADSRLAFHRWSSAKALVIDEISMIDGELFDRLDIIARSMRPSLKSTPWGGIQLVVSGDFFQLPPINAPNPAKEFAFEADCWARSFHLQVELTRVFRQSDAVLIDLLQGIRQGRRDDLRPILDICCNSGGGDSNDGKPEWDTATRLYPRNEDVRRVNNEKLRSLGEEITMYRAVDDGAEPWKAQLKQGIAPDVLEVCIGARVMLIKNTDVGAGLVNGTTGVVTGFNGEEGRRGPRVRFDCGAELVVETERWDVMEGEMVRATRRQIPLILAWAVSVHKCQGMTLDRIHTDLSRAFGCGMVYVALSRVRTLHGLRLSGFNPNKIKAHPKVVGFYDQLITSSSSSQLS